MMNFVFEKMENHRPRSPHDTTWRRPVIFLWRWADRRSWEGHHLHLPLLLLLLLLLLGCFFFFSDFIMTGSSVIRSASTNSFHISSRFLCLVLLFSLGSFSDAGSIPQCLLATLLHPLTTLQSSFRAVSEQFCINFIAVPTSVAQLFQSNFRAVPEQFQSNFGSIS